MQSLLGITSKSGESNSISSSLDTRFCTTTNLSLGTGTRSCSAPFAPKWSSESSEHPSNVPASLSLKYDLVSRTLCSGFVWPLFFCLVVNAHLSFFNKSDARSQRKGLPFSLCEARCGKSLCCHPLDRCHVIVALLPRIQHVRPLLHHLGAVAQVFGMIVSAPHGIRFGMSQLTLDPVGGKSQLV